MFVMESDRQRWNQRFQSRPLNPPSVPDFFAEQRASLPVGRVLDVASGDGAASLWFAAQGFDATALDISSVALARLQTFAQSQQLHITNVCLDLDDHGAISQKLPEPFDVVVMAHFKPSIQLLAKLRDLLRPGGQMMLTTFNRQHHLLNGFSERFCLAPKEFESAVDGLQCVHYQSVERNGSYMDDYRWLREG